MKHYLARTSCRHGNYEYSDVFLVVLDNPIGFFDGSTLDESDETDKAILTWNFDDCSVEPGGAYTDGGDRFISIKEWLQIDKHEHDVLAKILPSILFSEIWKTYQKKIGFNSNLSESKTQEKTVRTAA
tara:strand:- start:3994 stop:4377 length:384 start_codon:yes stop_codon:yes gene_type:complete